MLTRTAVQALQSRAKHLLVILALLAGLPAIAPAQDTARTRSYNKDLYAYAGIGTIEFLNAGLSFRTLKTIYIDFSIGKAFIQGSGFIVPIPGDFVKGGVSFRPSDERTTFILSLEYGIVGVDTHTGSERATIASLLGGLEWRHNNRFFVSPKAGVRYSAREFYDDEFVFGVQLACGWGFTIR